MNYTGYTEIRLDNDELARVYEQKKIDFPLKENEYLVTYDEENRATGKFIYQNNELKEVLFNTINSNFFGKIKPKNLEQELAFHMLKDDTTKIKILTGKFGTGKSFSMISNMIEKLEKGKIDKIVYVRNNIPVRDTIELGSLPGEEKDKLLPYLMPMADHLGGKENLLNKIDLGIIEPVHLGYLRGRDIKNSIIYCTEAQNLSIDHMKLLIGRVGEGSSLYLDGDIKTQVDKKIFKEQSGLKLAIERLAGNPLMGYVHLVKSERSEIAALADLLD